jgi:hypothetical protein
MQNSGNRQELLYDFYRSRRFVIGVAKKGKEKICRLQIGASEEKTRRYDCYNGKKYYLCCLFE